MVSTTQAKRGGILDRNGRVLAGTGVASSVGIMPGKLENMDSAIEQIAEVLGMRPEEIFENVIMTYFNVNKEAIWRETTDITEKADYEYRPRGFYEVEYPDIPDSEVVDYTENQDDTYCQCSISK